MHDPRPDKAAEYREQADEIRSMARQISLNEPRNKLLDAAKDLELLAQEEQRKAGQPVSRSKPEKQAW